ncbi:MULTISPECIES: cytochrome b [Chelativorans]|jgi:cytochrome b561|uniref:Cytochrome B561 n=1 Tax=Chelativorans sp. (strain BNC1) TaxID=266779 RepID=Q11M26_CHESB|nr:MULTISPECIES: cytochrome b [Chelativorans]
MWRNSPHSYGLIAILFHWTIAILFLGQIGLGYLTQITTGDPRLQFDLYQWHKSLGFLTMVLALLRLAWALAAAKPRPVPRTSRLEAIAASLTHSTLIAMTIFVPFTGWAVASTSPLMIPSFAFNLVLVPDLPLRRSEAAEALWSNIHAYLAYGSGVLAFLHATAALYHQFARRDGTLTRMLSPVSQDVRRGGTPAH